MHPSPPNPPGSSKAAPPCEEGSMPWNQFAGLEPNGIGLPRSVRLQGGGKKWVCHCGMRIRGPVVGLRWEPGMGKECCAGRRKEENKKRAGEQVWGVEGARQGNWAGCTFSCICCARGFPVCTIDPSFYFYSFFCLPRRAIPKFVGERKTKKDAEKREGPRVDYMSSNDP